ncbi:MAG: putative DNA binding domain-containing protein [Clostridia bacterium]
MRYCESEIVELKREYTEDIKREVMAFANTDGGKVYIGVGDSGEVIGLANADDVCLRVVQSCRNGLKPDITLFLKATIENVDEKQIVVLTVARGTATPYYLSDKGLKPSGVYIRIGTSSVPATDAHIRKMIKENDGDKYILQRSLEQNLTFAEATKEFETAGLKFGKPQMSTLGIIDKDKQFTNLGLLLSDECQHTIKVAVFEGTSKEIFRDRKEFGGSLFKQLKDTAEYISLNNKVHSTFEGLKRIDHPDYPPIAIREALLNAIVHREYGLSGSSFVNIYEDKIEILSLGSLVTGQSLDAAKQGFSLTRNEKLANVFYKLNMIEAYGTGIPRIMELYKNSIAKPTINVTETSFSITFPNSSYGENRKTVKIKTIQPEIEKAILDLILANGITTRDMVIEKLGLKSTQAYNVLTALVGQGKLNTRKNGRTIEYFLIDMV